MCTRIDQQDAPLPGVRSTGRHPGSDILPESIKTDKFICWFGAGIIAKLQLSNKDKVVDFGTACRRRRQIDPSRHLATNWLKAAA